MWALALAGFILFFFAVGKILLSVYKGKWKKGLFSGSILSLVGLLCFSIGVVAELEEIKRKNTNVTQTEEQQSNFTHKELPVVKPIEINDQSKNSTNVTEISQEDNSGKSIENVESKEPNRYRLKGRIGEKLNEFTKFYKWHSQTGTVFDNTLSRDVETDKETHVFTQIIHFQGSKFGTPDLEDALALGSDILPVDSLLISEQIGPKEIVYQYKSETLSRIWPVSTVIIYIKLGFNKEVLDMIITLGEINDTVFD
ncbi:hypothetical protein P9G84_13720 [Brevibacillus centrosporus]|uniref:hypothetical protein n=1 Tax=Brevibacillus centrosporus TaxID=54910 RepID=UPI0011421E35|nr:hypothetical protein [Brevibacillus centrosporus]MEC2130001.1 hypothetical protein [Brevibacillus centrosporus]GED32379.1 hypothetical protein BCE02nite_35200 [Brevibacillus centrosporus]